MLDGVTSELAERVALVTGAARGIGRAIALRLGASGAKVIVNYQRQAEAAAAVCEQIERAGGRAIAVQADVNERVAVDELVQRAVAWGGSLDILVNNAGVTRDTLLLRLSEDDWDAVLNTNLRGAYLVTRAALRHMWRQRYGRIVNISSVAGLVGNAGQANYAAAKAGLVGLTKATAREVASRGITVNVVAPGLIDVGMTAHLGAEQVQRFKEQIPLGRLGTAQEVAHAVVYLASDDAAYITGQVLNVDGGMVMR